LHVGVTVQKKSGAFPETPVQDSWRRLDLALHQPVLLLHALHSRRLRKAFWVSNAAKWSLLLVVTKGHKHAADFSEADLCNRPVLADMRPQCAVWPLNIQAIVECLLRAAHVFKTSRRARAVRAACQRRSM